MLLLLQPPIARPNASPHATRVSLFKLFVVMRADPRRWFRVVEDDTSRSIAFSQCRDWGLGARSLDFLPRGKASRPS